MSRSVRSAHLILAVLLITVVAQMLVQLRLAAALPATLDFVLVWFLILLNLAIAIAGWWTAHRVAWTVYLCLASPVWCSSEPRRRSLPFCCYAQYWWG